MKIFELIRKKYVTLGIYPAQTIQKRILNLRNLTFLSILSLPVILCFIYFFRGARTFEEYVNSAYFTSGLASGWLSFVTIVWKMTKLFEFIDSLEETVNKRLLVHPTLKLIYNETNRVSEKWSEIIYFLMTKMLILWVMIPIGCICFYFYFCTELANDSFQLPVPMWFPFDVKNPIGYVLAFILQYQMLIYHFYNVACILCIGLGTYLFFTKLTEDLKICVDAINELVKIQSAKLDIIQKMAEFIQLHSNAKQLVNDFQAVYRPIFVNNFTWSIGTISCLLLIIQILIVRHTSNLILLMFLIAEVILSFGLNFVFCELGERLTIAYDKIGYDINQLQWYMLPADIAKLLPTIIINVSQPVVIKSFGSIPCARDTYKQINNKGYSYFMVMRQFIA